MKSKLIVPVINRKLLLIFAVALLVLPLAGRAFAAAEMEGAAPAGGDAIVSALGDWGVPYHSASMSTMYQFQDFMKTDIGAKLLNIPAFKVINQMSPLSGAHCGILGIVTKDLPADFAAKLRAEIKVSSDKTWWNNSIGRTDVADAYLNATVAYFAAKSRAENFQDKMTQEADSRAEAIMAAVKEGKTSPKALADAAAELAPFAAISHKAQEAVAAAKSASMADADRMAAAINQNKEAANIAPIDKSAPAISGVEQNGGASKAAGQLLPYEISSGQVSRGGVAIAPIKFAASVSSNKLASGAPSSGPSVLARLGWAIKSAYQTLKVHMLLAFGLIFTVGTPMGWSLGYHNFAGLAFGVVVASYFTALASLSAVAYKFFAHPEGNAVSASTSAANAPSNKPAAGLPTGPSVLARLGQAIKSSYQTLKMHMLLAFGLIFVLGTPMGWGLGYHNFAGLIFGLVIAAYFTALAFMPAVAYKFFRG